MMNSNKGYCGSGHLQKSAVKRLLFSSRLVHYWIICICNFPNAFRHRCNPYKMLNCSLIEFAIASKISEIGKHIRAQID